MTTQLRAPRGGATGANGEWYEGGKFISTTDNPKKRGSYKPKGRVEIANGEYYDRREDFKPIYGIISPYIDWAEFRETENVKLIENGLDGFRNMYGDDAFDKWLPRMQMLAKYWGNGFRWFKEENGDLIVE